jgi:hypothetical protein
MRSDVAVPGLDPVRYGPDADEQVVAAGDLGRARDGLDEGPDRLDEMIGVERHHDGFGVLSSDPPGGPRQDRAGAARARLYPIGAPRKVRENRLEGGREVGPREDAQAPVRHEGKCSVHCVDDQRALARQRQELLGSLLRADRPEPRPDAPGEDRRPHRGE